MWKKFDSMDPLLQMRRKKKKESHFEGSPMIPRVSHTHRCWCTWAMSEQMPHGVHEDN